MDDEIVISGMSGRFPQCNSVDELFQALLESKDLVSDNHGRWPRDFYGLTNRAGVMKDIENFDSEFFGTYPRQSDGLDPRTRLLMESTFEAIIDAGIHPMDLRGSKTGVFVGMNTSRGDDSTFENKLNLSRMGKSMAMTPGMIAFTFDLRGPSYALDTACSSSLYAFCQAFRAMKGGECDAAIVCGASIVLDPYDSLEYKTMNVLSPTGKCQFLDENRDGFVKSESIVVTLLQKSKDARRIYATVKGCGTNTDGFKVDGLSKPSAEMQGKLLESIYEEFKINPLDVTYIEAHGTGTKVGDPEEISSLADFFCKGRKEPLLVGSIKTNIGHTELAAGLTSITKLVASMERGVLPPIIHLSQIGSDILPLIEGRIEPVLKNTVWTNGLMGTNSFGVGGTNSHVVLEPNHQMNQSSTKIETYRLVKFAGRNLEGAENFLRLLKENPNNSGLISMIENISRKPLRMYDHRGYIILGEDNPLHQIAEVQKNEREVWFVFAGIGSQWPHMGRDLMGLEYFRRSMEECASALRDYGINLIEILTNGNEDSFQNVGHCFIGIVAISICLVDLLKLLGIEPDGMIGHSVGEVCCAYADGLITRREAMLIAHARGVALKTTPSIQGVLAVIGMTSKEATPDLPGDICIACYNSTDNLTISGPTKSVTDYVKKLKANGKFAEVIHGANMAYHSKYISKAGDVLTNLLKPIIQEGKIASRKWITSSIKPQNVEDPTKEFKHTAEYHGNNLVNPVYFLNAMSKVPKDAIVIEMSPKVLLKTIIRRNLGLDAKIINLSSKTAENNHKFLLSAIGQLYMAGLNPDVSKLYNENQEITKVNRGTPSLASLIEWEPTHKCSVSYYNPEKSFGESIVVDLTDPDMKYLKGHVVDGRTIYPVMGYVYLAWEIFARLHKKTVSEVPVVVENIKIHRTIILPNNDAVTFNVNILKSSGNFEISEADAIVCEGRIWLLPEDNQSFSPEIQTETNDNDILMNNLDVYYKLSRFGFQYKNHFKAILKEEGNIGVLRWSDYWVPFLDAMIQFTALTRRNRNIYLPESIGKVIIDPVAHLKLIDKFDNEIPLQFHSDAGLLKCGKVEIRDLQFIKLAKRKSNVEPKLEKYQFIPYFLPSRMSLRDCLHLMMQTVIENLKDFSVLKLLEVYNDTKRRGADEDKYDLSKTLQEVLSEEIPIKTIHEKRNSNNIHSKIDIFDIVVFHGGVMNGLLTEVGDSFVLTDYYESYVGNSDVSLISKYSTSCGDFVLIRKIYREPENLKVITVKNDSFGWVDRLKEAIRQPTEKTAKVYLLSEKEVTCGAIGLFNSLRFETDASVARLFFILDETADEFSSDKKFYKDQLKKDLRVNVYENSTWGSYRYLPYERKKMEECAAAHAEVGTVGDFSNIKMVQNFPYPSKNSEKIFVYYAGLNFKDVLVANGLSRMPGSEENDFQIGYEFSGRRSDGKRVFGIVKQFAFATEVDVNTPYWIVPDSWSLEEAASVPFIYTTLYLAFRFKTTLQRGSSILIHDASGGMGMAAIHIALQYKCTIFATVGSHHSKEVLLKHFPELKKEYIFTSRDDSFELGVRELTNRLGVDYVLNCWSGDRFNSSLRCIAPYGHLIELEKPEFSPYSEIKSATFWKSTSIHAIPIDEILDEKYLGRFKDIKGMMDNDLDKGLIKPIPQRLVFDIDKIQDAMNQLQSTKHTGKVMLKIRNEEEELNAIPIPKYVSAIPKLYFNPERFYIIISDFGDLGLEIAQTLASKGAKYICMNSRKEPHQVYQFEFAKTVESWGVSVETSCFDTSSFEEAKSMLKKISKIKPIAGIFILAMDNGEASLENQTIENFRKVFKSKGIVTKNLDILSRELCPELEHFVVYSSMGFRKGNLEHEFANSTVERIIDERNKDGLPGLAMKWYNFAKESINEDAGHYNVQPILSRNEIVEEFLLNRSGILASSCPKKINENIQTADRLLESVFKFFGIKDKKKISDQTTLVELGMDSLMGFEIKQFLHREYDLDMSVKELREKTIGEIKEIHSGPMEARK